MSRDPTAARASKTRSSRSFSIKGRSRRRKSP